IQVIMRTTVRTEPAISNPKDYVCESGCSLFADGRRLSDPDHRHQRFRLGLASRNRPPHFSRLLPSKLYRTLSQLKRLSATGQ
ncbi:MAG: hypothetical protein AAFO91_05540, partial [Bacteroidota bacterium]